MAVTNGLIEVQTQVLVGDTPRDFVVNHLAVGVDTGPIGTGSWQALADAIKNTWINTTGHWGYTNNKITVLAYDFADAKPRPEKASSVYTPGTWQSADSNARQVALCVSFYSLRNLKRSRGRVFLCPTNNVSSYAGRPTTTNMNGAIDLIKGVNTAIGALTPSWYQTIHSIADNNFKAVTNWWCDDSWDIQRRRKLKATTRVTRT